MEIFVKWLSMLHEANVMKTQYYPSIYLCTLYLLLIKIKKCISKDSKEKEIHSLKTHE